MIYIGLDTSCYTTSVAAVDDDLKLLYDGRVVLSVEKGNRGLRQSEAVFQHHQNLSKLIDELFRAVAPQNVACITVSSKPRDIEDSYMPVFTAGINTARIMGSCMGIKINETSHQKNHIAAGVWSSKAKLGEKFLAYHVSGGTTELLLVDKYEKLPISIVGGSNDLNAGQFIDRVGVALGLEFPCGQIMDNLSSMHKSELIEIPVSTKGSQISFSGPETHVQRLVRGMKEKDEGFRAAISKGVFICIAKSIEKTIINACREHSVKEVLLVGGVMSNSIIKEHLSGSRNINNSNIKLFFAEARYSADNAVGTALLGVNNSIAFGGLDEQHKSIYSKRD